MAKDLYKNKAIMGIFDEGCMGMYNAIIQDELLAPMGVFKERLSQSALYYETTQVGDVEAQAAGAGLAGPALGHAMVREAGAFILDYQEGNHERVGRQGGPDHRGGRCANRPAGPARLPPGCASASASRGRRSINVIVKAVPCWCGFYV